MKYIPTVNLWDPEVSRKLHSGELKLQRGQWVQCGQGSKSRFVATHGKSIWAAHSEGKIGTRDSFKRLCESAGKVFDKTRDL